MHLFTFGKIKQFFFLIWVYFEPIACKEGYFGTNCSRECSPNCQPDTCLHTDGSCRCAPGWTGDNCTTGIFFCRRFDCILAIWVKAYNKPTINTPWLSKQFDVWLLYYYECVLQIKDLKEYVFL